MLRNDYNDLCAWPAVFLAVALMAAGCGDDATVGDNDSGTAEGDHDGNTTDNDAATEEGEISGMPSGSTSS